MGVTVAKFLDVGNGTQANQFTVGDRYEVTSISDLDETYKQLMDRPIACVMAVMGRAGRPNRIWKKYIGNDAGYQLRDPSFDERRALFECRVDRIATFGQPG